MVKYAINGPTISPIAAAMKKLAIDDVLFSLVVAETSVLINNVNAPAPKPASVRLIINIIGLHAIVYKNDEINDKIKHRIPATLILCLLCSREFNKMADIERPAEKAAKITPK